MYQNTAYLGPEGTYSEIALRQYGKSFSVSPCTSISTVFERVLTENADAGFVPIENMLKGPVTETLDLLLEYRGKVFIEDSYTMPICHSIGILKEFVADINNDLTTIPAVYSKREPLEQCSKFLTKYLPQSNLLYVESTGAAMEIVSTQKIKAAVVGAKESLIKHGFEVIADNISNVKYNKTRFVVIRKGNFESLAKNDSSGADTPTGLSNGYVTSICIDPRKDRQGILHDMLDVISSRHKVNMLSIHSRPNSSGGFVFYLDLEGHLHDKAIKMCVDELRHYCRTLTGDTAEITVFGSYWCEAFRPALFKKIGIIGGAGVMGQWFDIFFSQAGFSTFVFDKQSQASLEDLTSSCDVILLSLPMSEVENVVKKLAPLVKPGHLIVENCSIKNSAIPCLLKYIPKEVEVLGIHTMFGGDVESLRTETVIISKTEHSGQLADAFEDLLYKYGANIIRADIDKHDRLAAYTQSLQQLVLLILAELISSNFESVNDIKSFNTRNSRQTFNTMKRVLRQHDDLISDLQIRNNHASALRNDFLSISSEIINAINTGNIDRILSGVQKCRQFFGDELYKDS